MKNYLPIVLVLVASSASAQESAVLFGRVAGKDHASSVPAAWSATMTMVRKSDNKPVESSGCVGKPSDGDLFACLAPTNTDVRIIAQAVGYESRTADIPARKDLARVRPDLELERITPKLLSMQVDGDQFEKQLQQEADIAMWTGRRDIFELNFQAYKTAAAARVDLTAAVSRFESGDKYRELAILPNRVPKGAARFLLDPRTPVLSLPDQRELWRTVNDATLAAEIRTLAVGIMSSTPSLDPDIRTSLVGQLQQWVSTSDSTFRGAAARAVAGIATTTNDSAVKIESLKALTGSADPDAIKAAASLAESSQPEEVRREAVKVLANAPQSAAAQKVLSGVAKTDTSAEIRAIAATKVKPQ